MNEDAFASEAGRGLFVVCDGMGGAAAGEVASRLAVDTIVAGIASDDQPAVVSSDDGNPRNFLPQTTRLADAVRRSNDVIFRHAQADTECAGMGTTVVAVRIQQHVASVAHVGDSRAYLWHENHLEALTRDHSLLEEEIRLGLIDREKSAQSEHQNVLLRALGQESDIEVDVSEVPLQAGDLLLLCSDGLTRMVPEPAMADAIVKMREPQRICDTLIEIANRNGGLDNITVVVVEVERPWWTRVWNRLSGARNAEARAEV